MEGGVDAVTMRAVGRRLGVAPNALYSHVADRAELIDALLDDVLAAVPAPSVAAGDPVRSLHELLSATYEVLAAHPGLVPVYLSRQGARGPNAALLGRVMDDLLKEAGVEAVDVAVARRVLIVHAMGSAAFAAGALAEPGADHPLSVAESQEVFVRGLNWLLAGIVRDDIDTGGTSPDWGGTSVS
ncbi:transcriptional regulator, TetR family [Quadrisphaera granulorum]|uniref:TetR family transcriptional regulator n=1 Tax=Quadrisphaera granulorum TaxID=317664 RepID=A0A315ZP60_9ACTN|nr:TetR family transcriptional regulator [Quadrisphaera granulorum]SZE98995.1 transcriptional regulator, TetR family [Quadrisphaera granulorum]